MKDQTPLSDLSVEELLILRNLCVEAKEAFAPWSEKAGAHRTISATFSIPDQVRLREIADKISKLLREKMKAKEIKRHDL